MESNYTTTAACITSSNTINSSITLNDVYNTTGTINYNDVYTVTPNTI